MRLATIVVIALLPFGTFAQQQPTQSTAIEVVGVTPIDGIGLDLAKFPTNAQRITRSEEQGVADALVQGAAAIESNDPQGAPLQNDLQFRGFSVSPLLGAPEGLAVFQDGVRLNEPFGDTITWASVPSSAIESIELIPGANPVFGLNALGGAITLRTRGAAEDTSAAVSAGSFGRVEAEITTGGDRWFASASHLRESGWRDFSPADATHLFGSAKNGTGDVRLTLARSNITGNGAAPVALIATDRAAVFTHPDQTQNDLVMLSGSAQRAFQSSIFGQVTTYVRRTHTRTFNGDDSPYERCGGTSTAGLLCLDGNIVLDTAGAPVTIDEREEFDATNNRTRLAQTAFGVALQLDRSSTMRGHANRLLVGGSFDGGVAAFRSSTELAALTDDRGTIGSGITAAESLVHLATRSMTLSAFVADILSLTPRLTLTGSARFNHVRIRLDDRIGVDLEGDHSFAQLHPSLGFAFDIGRGLNAFGNVGAAGRTPTPVELSCADAADPCRLPNAFISDPPLKAVRARTLEAGLRGRHRFITWSAAVHRSTTKDDLMFISSGRARGEGHFANVGTTLREGVEATVEGRSGTRTQWFASYSFVDATFVTPFTAAAPNHPAATDGGIDVEPGDRLPLAPRHMSKVGASLNLTPRLRVAATVRRTSEQYVRGDEANLAEPLPAYTTTDARLEVAAGTRATVVAAVRNLLDSDYATFGVYGDAEGILGEAYGERERFITPAGPRTLLLTVRVRY